MKSTAFLYRWRLVPGREEEFRAAWVEATRQIHARCASFGARLHRAKDGEFSSYAHWPSEDARTVCFEDPQLSAMPCFAAMRVCIEHSYDEVALEVLDDLLEPM